MTLLLLAALAGASALAVVQGSSPSDSHYVAAVVEYSPTMFTQLNALDNMLGNIQALGAFMDNASSQGADILVFPEGALVGNANEVYLSVVPDGSASFNPCLAAVNDTGQPLRALSCLAKKHNMYLVVNLDEKVPCSRDEDANCPAIKYYHYNTNVVLNRGGTVIARYRKWNLFGEYGKQKPSAVERVTFDTDFGVRFGVFTCFDIMFEEPCLTLVRDMNITDIVYPHQWFSEVPYLSAVQIHAAWAHSQDVNLISAGYNYPAVGYTGSGIYRGRNGPIESLFSAEMGSTLIVHRVPKRGHWDEGDADPTSTVLNPEVTYAGGKDPYDEMAKLWMGQDHFPLYTTKLLPRPLVGEELFIQHSVCDRGLCCDFSVASRGLNLFKTINSAAGSVHGGHGILQYFFSTTERPFNITEAEEEFDGFYYRLAVFQGVRSNSGLATDGIQVCSVVSCLNKELASCGWNAKGLSSPNILWTEFTNITITGSFPQTRLLMADTEAGPKYSVMPPSSYFWDVQLESKSALRHARLHLQRSVMDLRTFAIYGRVFEWDGMEPTTNV